MCSKSPFAVTMRLVAGKRAVLGNGSKALGSTAVVTSPRQAPLEVRCQTSKPSFNAGAPGSVLLSQPKAMTSAWHQNLRRQWNSSGNTVVVDLNPSSVCDGGSGRRASEWWPNGHHRSRRRFAPIRASAFSNPNSHFQPESPNGAPSPSRAPAPIESASDPNPQPSSPELSLREAVLQLKTEQETLRLASEQPSTRPAWEVGTKSARSGQSDGITLIRRTVRGGQTEDHPGTVVVSSALFFFFLRSFSARM